MDGLPLQEQTGLSYASTAKQVDITGIEQSVMHACGHDVHITAMVGAARRTFPTVKVANKAPSISF